ncbi:MAG: UDP-N-acetylmuramoyl-L-alanyl-D-glutamate--2,6-diaminopimelate ligase [Gammaproteobacteria bacterium]
MSALLDGYAELAAGADCDVSGLCLDSRIVRPGDCFIALRGAARHGANYVHDALAAGAMAVLVDASDASLSAPVPVIGVRDLRRVVGPIASRFYGEPSRDLDVVAVTGTNGKTTVAHLVADALRTVRGASGYAGTLGLGHFGAFVPNPNTTPDPITLQAFFAELRDTGCRAAAIEVSSHGIAQHRVDGCAIDVAVFTNLSHDHLDYHESLAAYAATKKSLFRHPGLRHAVVNIDDPIGREIVDEAVSTLSVATFSLAVDSGAAFTLVRHTLREAGSELVIATPHGEVRLHTTLPGEFNLQNLIAALAALVAVGIPTAAAAAALSNISEVAGRMQRVATGERAEPLVVVDYAHTPDSLARAIAALRVHTEGELICVFGCGGDRDRSKRVPMGRAAASGADRVIVTSDNPRSEPAAAIIDDILAGTEKSAKTTVIEDRAAAIRHAIEGASVTDVVLIAGKGHESMQELNGQRQPFSDTAHALAALRGRTS